MPKGLKAGFETNWTTFGQGPRAALMIHCSLAHSGSWGAMARHLSGALDMTAFDLPGHGRSAPWDDRAELQGETVRIAAEFLTGPTDIIGHSFGATVALRLAIERPELVRSLVLLEPVFFAAGLAARPELRAGFDAAMAPFVDAMRAGDRMAAAEAFLAVWGGGADWSAISTPDRETLAAQMPIVQAGQPALYEDVGGMLAEGRLEAVERPVLLIEGSLSPEIIPAITEGLAARLPHARRAVIAGASHMLPVTHGRQVSAEVLRFLREV
ncbi:alpha/beta fold hydrolase [Roseovarius aestuariivivens]|uniref:alpha/beta fold hydrolase n=1 Tax=Roseovarius aestuariivivens TaxID=1888910 RepID=UPI001081F066|nr:alpha/beta hydrolase [Roseovarius aestuariivivens]